ncbi:uncharacterized protein LOC127252508 [Andrographis paniculata]|uniref:uncharacterized protein LOC127252508 n=1 Tax=Andrographis paniculata TaxID=175694 RepID=UPI0021E862C9|nr:uncharacterized protein LOC127252508 [Andrographis paniculata]
MKVVAEEIIREEVAPEADLEEAAARPDSERTVSNETLADEEEESLHFAREIEEDLFGAEKTRNDKGGKALEVAAGENGSKRKEDPAPEPFGKKQRVKVALRKNPTPFRRATRQEKGKARPTTERVPPKPLSPINDKPAPVNQQGASEPTAAGTGNKTTPVNQPRAEEPTVTGPEEERDTVITEETIGGIDVTMEAYKEQLAEVPVATTVEAASVSTSDIDNTGTAEGEPMPYGPKTPVETGTPAETLTPVLEKSDKTIFDEEEDKEEKKFREEQAQLLTAMQQLQQKKASSALETRIEALETQAASLGASQTEILKALSAITQHNAILMEQQLDTTKSLQRMEELVRQLTKNLPPG